MMESSHSEEFPGAGSSAQPDQVSNTEDEVELIEFFTFASESDAGDEDFSRRNQANEEEEDEVTHIQDPLPTVRPILQFCWRLIKWPLAFFIVNMGVVIGLIVTGTNVYYGDRSAEDDIVTLWRFQVFCLLLDSFECIGNWFRCFVVESTNSKLARPSGCKQY